MDYIIDPKLIYFSGISENLCLTLSLLGILGLLASTAMVCISVVEVILDKDDDYKPLGKIGTICFIVFLCMLIIAQFIPDKETCYAMLAAKIVTKGNIEVTVEALKSIVDYIAEVCAK